MSFSDRKVVVHYHIFKNAGSSVDQLLRKNFPEQWVGFDGATPGSVIPTAELEKRINTSVDMVAFSSHQVVPPLPQVEAEVYPIVFLRDPIDRIKSAYLFEWQKQLGLEKPKGSFVEFVKTKFTHKRKSSVEEFQTIRLSNTDTTSFNPKALSDDQLIEQACDFISSLEFVGVVDRFDDSKVLLQKYLSPAFPGFKIHDVKANVLQDISMPQERKRRQIQEELGDDLFETIVERNELDEKLYQFGKIHFEKLLKNSMKEVEKTA